MIRQYNYDTERTLTGTSFCFPSATAASSSFVRPFLLLLASLVVLRTVNAAPSPRSPFFSRRDARVRGRRAGEPGGKDRPTEPAGCRDDGWCRTYPFPHHHVLVTVESNISPLSVHSQGTVREVPCNWAESSCWHPLSLIHTSY